MSIQQFCLKWNNHQPNFISVFTTLLNTEALVDVTLAAEGKHVQAHRMVLSACSVYFQALFMETPSRYPIVILKDVKFSVLRILVDFMYYGEVNVSQEQLPQVLETARTLKIKGLTEMPDSTLMRAQGIKNDSMPMSDHIDRPSVSPSHSPLMTKRKKNRRLSLSMGSEDNRQGDSGSSPPSVELAQSDEITLSSVQQQRRRQETYDERTVDATQQTEEQHNNMQADDSLLMETNPPGMPQGGQWSMMEYPRYSNACIGGGIQQDGTMGYIGNVMSQHIDMSEYGQNVGVTGPSPGPSCLNDSQAQQDQTPQQQQPKRRRTANPQSEENFQRALEAVRFGGIGFCKAARMFGVNNRTLWLEYKKKGYPNNRPSIKSRIKREHTTPPPEHKEDNHPAEQQMALLCPPHPVPVVGFIDSRPVDFPLQGMGHNSPLNLHGLNFNTMQ